MGKSIITESEIAEMVAYATVLTHNNVVDDVMSAEEVDLMMINFIRLYNSDEDKALDFYKKRVLELKEKLGAVSNE